MVNLLDETLKKLGISYDEMTDIEKQTYDNWLTQMSASQEVSDIREHIDQMKNAIIAELADEPEHISSDIFPFFKVSNPKNVYLKARLKNYLLLSAFLATPDQARKAIENNLKNIKKAV